MRNRIEGYFSKLREKSRFKIENKKKSKIDFGGNLFFVVLGIVQPRGRRERYPGTNGYRVPARKKILGTDGYRVPARKKIFGTDGYLGTGKIFTYADPWCNLQHWFKSEPFP